MKTKLTILFLLFATTMMAQELKVKSFSMDMMDLSSQTNPVFDANEEKFALVKVDLVVPDATFKGDTIKTEYKDGIYNIYLTPGATYLEISVPGLHQLSYMFPEELVPVSGNTYRLVIDCPFKYDIFDHVSMSEFYKAKAKSLEGEGVLHDHAINIAWPIQIAGMTKEDLSALQKTLIKSVFGNNVMSSDIKTIISSVLKKEKNLLGGIELNKTRLELYFEKRQGNFLIFKKVKVGTESEGEQEIWESHLLYNMRTKKCMSRVADFNGNKRTLYNKVIDSIQIELNGGGSDAEEEDPFNAQDFFYKFEDFLNLPFIIKGDLHTITFDPHVSSMGENIDATILCDESLGKDFIEDWYNSKEYLRLYNSYSE